MDDLGIIGRRNMVCGLHVHVDIPDPARRIDIMNRLLPFLPIFLALSTSSPFWRKRPTGLMGYRLAHYDELPRTGLPAIFPENADYDRYVETLAAAGVIPDASYVWWAVRPSLKYPTLELRVADCCTDVNDAIAIAALYRCVIRALWRRPELNAHPTPITRLIIDENKWRAQRYGLAGGLIHERQRRLVPFPEIIETLLQALAEDIAYFENTAEIETVREIVRRGTSAHRQMAIYEDGRRRGLSRVDAVRDVVDWLIKTTRPADREAAA
jgi:carboxylate-amine ligase